MPSASRKGIRGLSGFKTEGGGGGGVARVNLKSDGGGVAPAVPDGVGPVAPSGDGGLVSGTVTPGRIRSIKASAKVRAGIYEGNAVRMTFLVKKFPILDASYLPLKRLFTRGWL